MPRKQPIALDVVLNGKKLCRAGVEEGALSAVLTAVWKRKRVNDAGVTEPARDELHLSIGGMASGAETHGAGDGGEFLTWVRRKLKLGDTITLQVVAPEGVSRPRQRRTLPGLPLRVRQEQVRQLAAKTGMKATLAPKKKPRSK